jgi:ATP-dependent DNA helicase RecG
MLCRSPMTSRMHLTGTVPKEKISLDTQVISLSKLESFRLSQAASKNLALALASLTDKRDAKESTIEDLLNYLPMRYEDRSNLARIADLKDGTEASLDLYVRVSGGYQVGRNRSNSLYIFEITANDSTHSGKPVVVWWFISGKFAQRIIAYNRKRFTKGTRFVAFGRWEWDGRRNAFALKLNRPDELEILPGQNNEPELLKFAESYEDDQMEEDESTDPALVAVHAGRRVPVYRKLGQFQTKKLRELMHRVFEELDPSEVGETLPEDLLKRQSLIKRSNALKNIHFPDEDAPISEYQVSRSPAHIRLIFEEFFWSSLAIALRRQSRVREEKGTKIRITEELRDQLINFAPFPLTAAQLRAIDSIFNDLQSDAPMNRLLQGDVGSGKTIVALITMLAALENGYQSALMVPTEILAEQHARNIKRLLSATPYRVELLKGSQRVAEKRRLQEAIKSGEVHACVGTHALIQEGVEFNNLGVVVIDEQHRFGVLQRAALRERSFNPDVLVMTATPIPRSLAMTVYGDLDVSVIDELPPGRTPIKTVVVGEDQRNGVYKGIEREIGLGRQVYIIYPLVEESEKVDLKDATRMYEHLRDSVFPNYSIGLLHGKLKQAEKDEVMNLFVKGELQILVATTVVEVGVDVPNASVMVIEHAERFGLSQLHQLRGRVGRGVASSYCVLIASDKKTSVARERLGIMEETSDGFRIAEKDLEIRGPGELMGTRQSGIPAFRVGNLVRDLAILERAKREADYYLTTRGESRETLDLIMKINQDPKFGLATVG